MTEVSDIIQQDKALFLEHLTPEQRTDFEVSRHVFCVSNIGRRFRIRCGPTTGNIDWIQDGHVLGTFCAVPRSRTSLAPPMMTEFGVWLGQLLQLQCDEDGLMRVAVVYAGTKPNEYYYPG